VKFLVLDPLETFQKIAGFLGAQREDYEFDGQVYYKNSAVFFEKYDAVICIHTVEPLNSYILNKCLFLNVKTMVVFDGVYEWDNAYKNPKHIQAGIKLYDPISSDMALIVGEPINYLSHINPGVTFHSYRPTRMIISKNSRNAVAEGTLLLTTAKTPYFDLKERERLVNLYREVLTVCRSIFDNIEFRFFDESLLSDIGGDLTKNKTDGSFSDAIKNYSNLITTPSSVSIEAMALGVAVAHLDYRDSPLFFQAGWRLNQSVDIPDVLSSMNAKTLERINFQYSEVKSVLDPEINETNTIESLLGEAEYKNHMSAQLNASEARLLDSRWNFNVKAIAKNILKKIGVR